MFRLSCLTLEFEHYGMKIEESEKAGCDCLAVRAQWQNIGGSSQSCPGFDSRWLLAFSPCSILPRFTESCCALSSKCLMSVPFIFFSKVPAVCLFGGSAAWVSGICSRRGWLLLLPLCLSSRTHSQFQWSQWPSHLWEVHQLGDWWWVSTCTPILFPVSLCVWDILPFLTPTHTHSPC